MKVVTGAATSGDCAHGELVSGAVKRPSLGRINRVQAEVHTTSRVVVMAAVQARLADPRVAELAMALSAALASPDACASELFSESLQALLSIQGRLRRPVARHRLSHGESDPMPQSIACVCGMRIRVSDSSVGKPIKCPACGVPIVLPLVEFEEHDPFPEGSTTSYRIRSKGTTSRYMLDALSPRHRWSSFWSSSSSAGKNRGGQFCP